jgi:hypothetical protein
VIYFCGVYGFCVWWLPRVVSGNLACGWGDVGLEGLWAGVVRFN